jgi:3-isopropylmalate/(R)-2-methylmalate dehydratase small subunit
VEPFTTLTAVAAPLWQENIDTDQIISAKELMKPQKTGFGEGLFAGWRYLEGRTENPEFILNRSPYRNAEILVAGPNFGCGSSRENAVWALRDFGIRALIAPSFSSIFTANCARNGVLVISLAHDVVAALVDEIAPHQATMTVDLIGQRVRTPRGREIAFRVPALEREMLLNGLDAIALTLSWSAEIDAFQARDHVARPWLWT